MNESNWLASGDPAAMLHHLLYKPVGVGGRLRGTDEGGPALISDRKMRLFACACVRQSWSLLDQLSQRVVETAERFADGEADKEETFRLASSCRTIARCLMPIWDSSEEATAVIDTAHMHNQEILPTYANLLREIVGNPFDAPDAGTTVRMASDMSGPALTSGAAEEWLPPPWLTPTVVSLANAAYDYRLENGILDSARLAILSDALEEAGCNNEGLLRHLRRPVRCRLCKGRGSIERPVICGPDVSEQEMRRMADEAGGPIACPSCRQNVCGPHVRGCWVLDLLLHKT